MLNLRIDFYMCMCMYALTSGNKDINISSYLQAVDVEKPCAVLSTYTLHPGLVIRYSLSIRLKLHKRRRSSLTAL